MGVLIVPPLDEVPYPTLGQLVCDFIEDRAVYGPGSLKGLPAELDAEKRAAIYSLYEVFPQGHELAGRRRYKRGGLSWRKGTAKTEWAAWIAFAELHPEGPVRCDGFDAYGNPVGRPVRDPYIPMVAFTEGQVAELAYGALMVVVQEGPDADLFDAGLDRIIRLNDRGRADGKAVPMAGSPNARDGARTTFQHFDETHRMYLPSLVNAHETMMANLEKRPLDDPWSLETTTAGQPGQGSVAEKTHREAEAIERGEVADPDLFYFHREAGKHHDLLTMEGRIAAVSEATGPVGEYGPGQFRGIAKQWDRRGADRSYLERVWLNRWTKSSSQAFDVVRYEALLVPQRIPDGAFVTVGFDGARFKDSTAFVVTEVLTGIQELYLWEKPADWPADEDDWEVPVEEVNSTLEDIMKRFDVWKLYGDPPHWVETMGDWAAKWPDVIEEWWTNRTKITAYAVRAFIEAIDSVSVHHNGNADLIRHVGNAGRKDLRILDDDGKPLFILDKQEKEKKFDGAMAAVLSWAACLDARKAGVTSRKRPPSRIRKIR
ncbi:Phage terminase-like protein, large subunit, contains N-terminal HTH domain [Arthrobacter alpinus]|uniref:Phage terminase-like protein, large subunit, contains N-terminal HTH domain n=1 Tax=Arthrobacter alpinus TaxID=656366 RepID=A0A1H5GZ10_9MICC|nr:Phage terminase-like protein, large subunit, contains N-terminal HTH domain [Arthrobacter alpinus]